MAEKIKINRERRWNRLRALRHRGESFDGQHDYLDGDSANNVTVGDLRRARAAAAGKEQVSDGK